MSRIYFAFLLIYILHISLICAILSSKAVNDMTVGDKIKKIRTFRGMTQKELGLAIGLEEKGADNRKPGSYYHTKAQKSIPNPKLGVGQIRDHAR